MEINELVAQGAILEPFVVTVSAVVLKATQLKTRYKPTVALTVGIVLGAASSFLLQQPVTDGIAVGFFAGCTAALVYLAGKTIERAQHN